MKCGVIIVVLMQVAWMAILPGLSKDADQRAPYVATTEATVRTPTATANEQMIGVQYRREQSKMKAQEGSVRQCRCGKQRLEVHGRKLTAAGLDFANAIRIFAFISLQQGKYKQSAALLEESLKIYSATADKGEQEVLKILTKYAALLRHTSHMREARGVERRMERIRSSIIAAKAASIDDRRFRALMARRSGPVSMPLNIKRLDRTVVFMDIMSMSNQSDKQPITGFSLNSKEGARKVHWLLRAAPRFEIRTHKLLAVRSSLIQDK